MLPKPVPAGPSLPAGVTTSVSSQRAGDRPRRGAVGKAGVGLATRDESNARGIVHVAVAIRIDRALEPLDQLVGAPIDREPPAVGQPACDTNREHLAPRATPSGHPGRGRPRGCRRARCRASRRRRAFQARHCPRVAVHDIDPGSTLPRRRGAVGRRPCREGDRDGAPVVAGQRQRRLATTRARRASSATTRPTPDTRREPDTAHTRAPFEQRDGRRVEHRREPVITRVKLNSGWLPAPPLRSSERRRCWNASSLDVPARSARAGDAAFCAMRSARDGAS